MYLSILWASVLYNTRMIANGSLPGSSQAKEVEILPLKLGPFSARDRLCLCWFGEKLTSLHFPFASFLFYL